MTSANIKNISVDRTSLLGAKPPKDQKANEAAQKLASGEQTTLKNGENVVSNSPIFPNAGI